jgi:hypothetical protein
MPFSVTLVSKRKHFIKFFESTSFIIFYFVFFSPVYYDKMPLFGFFICFLSFFVVLGIEPGASCSLDKHFTTWATLQSFCFILLLWWGLTNFTSVGFKHMILQSPPPEWLRLQVCAITFSKVLLLSVHLHLRQTASFSSILKITSYLFYIFIHEKG